MARKPRWKLEIERADPRHDLEIPAPDWVIQTHHHVQPETELEALMMSAPGDHIPEIVPKQLDTYDALDEILGVELELDDVERSVLDALFVSGLSIRDAATVLGTSPSTVWRIKESALERIRHRAEWPRIGTGDTDHLPDGGHQGAETGEVRSDPDVPVTETGRTIWTRKPEVW